MTKLPLEGLRVGDFSWFGAGPIAGQMLCTFGAEVVRIESETKLDSLRVAQPVRLNPDGSPHTGYNVLRLLQQLQCRQALDAAQSQHGEGPGDRLPPARKVRHLPHQLHSPRHRKVEPSLRTDSEGQPPNHRRLRADAGDGRARTSDFLGFGAVLTPVTGISYMSGFPNRPPIGVGTNYPDYVINPGHTVTAILAALRYRNRTGKGQCIELPQIESVVNALGTAVLDAWRTATPRTAAVTAAPFSPRMAPSAAPTTRPPKARPTAGSPSPAAPMPSGPRSAMPSVRRRQRSTPASPHSSPARPTKTRSKRPSAISYASGEPRT